MIRVLLCLLLTVSAFCCTAETVKDFSRDSLQHIRQGYSQQAYLLVLWSLDCPPCFREMRFLADWHQAHSDVPLIMIATDPPELREDVVDALRRMKLEHLDNWQFASHYAEALRYSIDPGWHGELPRSYWVSADGKQLGHSGVLTPQWLQQRLQELAPGTF